MNQGFQNIGIFNPGVFSLYSDGTNKIEANHTLDELFTLVPLAEELGFNRYWLGEHYNFDVGWRNPEILISILAGMTSKIRLGTAGVLLKMYSPLLVAQNYRLLEYLYSDRIDLGIAKGLANKIYFDAFGLKAGDELDFNRKTEELMQFLYSSNLENDILVPPFYNSAPAVWVLGTSSFDLAIQYKLKVCLSIFHASKKDGYDQRVIDRFRNEYYKEWNEYPELTIAASGICSQSEKKSIQNAKEYHNTFFHPNIIGGPEECYLQISKLIQNYEADSFMFMDLNRDIDQKIECYNLISEIFNLKKAISE